MTFKSVEELYNTGIKKSSAADCTITHGGHIHDLAIKAGCHENELIDFSANINPAGPPASFRSTIKRTLDQVIHYPDHHYLDLVEAIALKHGGEPENIVVGNGSTELLYALPRALACKRALLPVPSYSDYGAAFRMAGIPVETVQLCAENNFLFEIEHLVKHLSGGDVVVFGQPNNPTGRMVNRDAIVNVAKAAPFSMFIIDESFADFVDGYSSLSLDALPNVIVLKSLTKFYAIPGLRLGFVHAAVPVANALRASLPLWSVNVFAQAVGIESLKDIAYAEAARHLIKRNRIRQVRRLNAIGSLRVFNGCANFLLLSLSNPRVNARRLAEELLKHKIAVRLCESFEGLDNNYIRIAVRSDEENKLLAFHLAEILNCKPIRIKRNHRTPAIMFQGTSSNAGKSVLTAAMCRVMVQDGISVAPFKAQNMSLNSFVTSDGGEMGRAQVVQAQACRVAPNVSMNPILLKPNSDTGSQVIVNGKSVGSMRVAQYVKYKSTAFNIVKENYDSLASQFDAIVLEGAGSPAEVNLKDHDIVNMRMASYAKSPVLLVGDIDRGGVFASFLGTMETFEPWEQSLVAGFIVNRFRGDASLLQSAFDYTFHHTGKPVIGVVPYITALGLPEEDSVTFKCSESLWDDTRKPVVTIGIIDLPHISNFTDFDALLLEPDVALRIVRTPGDLDSLDAVIIPGSKNVPADLAWLRSSQIADRLVSLAHGNKIEIIGICGGYQMLGKEIADPYGIESGGCKCSGLSLLDISTILGRDKILERTVATHKISGHTVSGYEIHHGRTTINGITVLLTNSKNEPAGAGTSDHRIWGTYLHGVFDRDPFRRWFIDRLRSNKGIFPLGKIVAQYDIESALDRLADIFRAAVNVKNIYRIMGL
ncbi:MAG: cobyric acid synthase [Chitinispirillaceae bacterium]|nr:cobyric acid synthase [Chitinispirillaceae bacterium]